MFKQKENKRKKQSKNNTSSANTNNNRFQSHFRKFKNGKFTGHPQYVYDDTGKEYKVLGITSSEKTNGVINIRLECNPEPNNTKPAYVRTKPDTVKKGVRNERLKGWKFSENDKKKVRQIISSHEKEK